MSMPRGLFSRHRRERLKPRCEERLSAGKSFPDPSPVHCYTFSWVGPVPYCQTAIPLGPLTAPRSLSHQWLPIDKNKANCAAGTTSATPPLLFFATERMFFFFLRKWLSHFAKHASMFSELGCPLFRHFTVNTRWTRKSFPLFSLAFNEPVWTADLLKLFMLLLASNVSWIVEKE